MTCHNSYTNFTISQENKMVTLTYNTYKALEHNRNGTYLQQHMTVENFQSCKREKSHRPLTSWEHRTYFNKLSRQIVWRELSKIVGGDQIGQQG